ncbi:MAG: ATP-binding cassette domain-containing protein [Spirochaetes bacterium]|nr:ATP-binding cassette domain-containing protein [Spirochaetota bacterium]
MEIIQAKELTFHFQQNQVLHNLNFEVYKNEFVTFVGPSGCGKTTLLNLISGILPSDPLHLSNSAEKIAFVFQHDTLLPWRSAIKNILLPLELNNIPITDEIREQAHKIFDQVGLKGYENYYPSQLSGGMKKRVEIARALITQPDLLILDEPFSSLDIITREKLNLLMRNLKRLTNCTIIMVTHSVEEACFLSDKVYVLSAIPGEIISVHKIHQDDKSPADQFILSGDELETDKAIRKAAKLLWKSDPQVNQGNKQQARKEKNKNSFLTHLLIPGELLIFLILLSLIKYLFNIDDYLFPYPHQVGVRMITTLQDFTILGHLGTTIFESLTGFFIAFFITLISGYLIAKSKLLNQLAMPFLIAANTIPSVALAPFLVLWFGFGNTPRIIISVIVIFFPMLINNISAIRMATEQLSTLILFYKPNRIKTFTNFELPASLPVIFSGVKVSITLSVIGAVVGEFISGSRGLGALVVTAKASFDTELMFVALIWLIILGLSYYNLANLVYKFIEKKVHH